MTDQSESKYGQTLNVVPGLENAISHNLYSNWLSLSPRARSGAIDLPPLPCTPQCLQNADLAIVVSAAGPMEQAGWYKYNYDVFFDTS